MPILLPAAIIGSAALGAVASSSAASKAAKAETNAANQATQVANDHYNQIRSDLSPDVAAGQKALTDAGNYASGYGTSTAYQASQAANKLITGGGGSQQAALEQTPGYQFTLSQGLKAVGNANATRGGGAFARGATNFATQTANGTYGDQVNRTVANAQLQNQSFGDQYNRLMGQAQLGENAAAQTGAYGVQTAQNIGNNLTSAGNAKAAGQIATGNAIGNLGSSIPSALIYNNLFSGGIPTGGGGMYALPASSGINYNASTIAGGF